MTRIFKTMVFLPGAVLLFWMNSALATQVLLQLPPEAQGLEGHLTGAASSFEAVEREGATPQDIMAAARADYGRLAGALYQVGHYGGVISIQVDGREVSDISPFAQIQSIGQIVIRVQPGPLFTFSEASVAPLAPATELPEGFAAGQPAYSDTIKDATRAGVEAWQDVGHAKIEIGGQSVTADHRNSQLATRITLDPGPRLVFGDLKVNNSGKVRNERIVEIAGLPTGQLYTPKELKRATERLRETGAFSSVVLEGADTIRPVDTLDVNATVTDAKPRRIGFGAELSSLEGVSLSGFWLHRNIFGGAERLRFDASIERIGGTTDGEDYLLSVRYERPATFSPDTSLVLGARLQQLETDDYRERSFRIGGGVSHR
ncbi:MAG: outer membrane protein assembly factor, partial [Pseudomonadota bacterium]